MKNLMLHPDPVPLSGDLHRPTPLQTNVIITTEDRVGTVARVALVTLVSILVGATFILLVRMTSVAERLHHITLLVAAGLMSLGVQVFLAPWLVRSLGRRGTWIIDQHSISWQPRLGRRRLLLWDEVEAVRFHPMTIQVRGTHRRLNTTITLGSGLLSLNEWQSLRHTIADQLLHRFPHLDVELDTTRPSQRWTRDPRVVHLGALSFLTAMAVFAAMLSLNENLTWPGYAVAAIATVRLLGWVIGQWRTPWQIPVRENQQHSLQAA